MDDDKLLVLTSLVVVAYIMLKEEKEEIIVVETVKPKTPFIPTTTPEVVVPTPVLIPNSTILGCINPNATNFNNIATKDDGSCIVPTISGCTDVNSDNFNPNANSDDGSCSYSPIISPITGCIDSTADNYNSYANTDDGSCVYSSGNSYNNGNLECWTDKCPNPSVASNPNWKSCPSTYPLSNPPTCTVAPVQGLDISFDNLVVGVYNEGPYNTNDCVYSVDINIINMPQGYVWNLRRKAFLGNGVWKWNKSLGYETNSIMTSPSITKTGLCPGRYVVTILGNNGTYGGGMVMEKELIINQPPLPAIDVISTLPSGGSCNGGVRFVVRQRCNPSAPPWSNCNMSFSNKTKFRIKDNTGNVVLDSGGQYGRMGVNMNSMNYEYDLKPSGSSRTSSIASSTYQDSWMNINLCAGNYTLELIRNTDLSILETTNFTIQ